MMKFPKGKIIGENEGAKGAEPIWHFNSNKVEKWHREFKQWLNNELAVHQHENFAVQHQNLIKIIYRIENHWLVSEE